MNIVRLVLLMLLVLAVTEVHSLARFRKNAQKRLERQESSSLRRVKREVVFSRATEGLTYGSELSGFFSSATEGWTYGSGPTGVNNWPHLFVTCGGKFQSPINIDTDDVVFDKKLGSFTFENFDTEEDAIVNVVNNGHSVTVVYEHLDMRLHSPGLAHDSVYRVNNLHFHWGSKNSVGSEHTIDGDKFPMEMHIVTWNTGYGTIENALNYYDGLAVLALLFKVGGDDNPLLTPLITTLNEIQNPGDEKDIPVFKFISLIKNKDKYYRYHGGLTTPPCIEVVEWTIFKDTIRISEAQMNAFRNLKSPDENGGTKPLVNNFRSVQPTNRRKVRASFDSD